MKNIRRTMSVLLSLLIVITMFTSLPLSVTAATDDEAAVANDGDVNVTYNMFSAQIYSSSFNLGHPSMAREYYNSLKSDASFLASVAAWESAHVVASPSYSLDMGEINMKDYYKTVIFDLLAQEDSKSGLDTFLKMATHKETSYAVGVFKSIAKDEKLTAEEINSLTPEQAATLTEKTGIYKALKGTGLAMKIAGWAKNAKETFDTFAKYQSIADLKDGTEQLLTLIANDTNNPIELREAASDCVGYFGEGYQRALNQLAGGAVQVAGFTWDLISKTSLDWAWDMIAASITTAGGTPVAAAVLAGLKGGRLLANMIFSTDKEVESYFKLKAAVAFEDSVKRITNNLSTGDFEHSDLDAYIYLEAIKLYEKTILLGFDYTGDMIEMAGNSAYNQMTDFLFGKYSECQALLQQNDANKTRTENFYKTFEENILKNYKRIYCPDYDVIISGTGSNLVQAESMSLSQIADLHVGDNGYIGDFIKAVYSPSNYNSLFSEEWSSDNESIIKFNPTLTYNDGLFECLSPGTCTVTCTNSDGLTSSIVVAVGNAVVPDEHDYYSDFTYTVSNNSATITKYTGTASRVVVPSTLGGYPVEKIAANAFADCKQLTSISLPENLRTMEGLIFSGCDKLKTVTIPQYVTQMYSRISINYSYDDRSTFEGSYVETVIFESGRTAIPYRACRSASRLSKVVIPNGVLSIGADAFTGCSNLTIYGYHGNYSETYATNNNIPFAEIECDHSVLITKHACQPDSCTDGYSGDTYCQICGLLIDTGHTIEKTGHHYSTEVVAEATCISNGIIKHTCDVCHDSYLEYTETSGHSYIDTVVPPTCHSAGYTNHKCSVCSYQYNDSFINPLAHNYTDTIVAPLCNHAGYTEHHCQNCDFCYTDNYTDALQHYYEMTIIKESTNNSVGIMQYKCKYCDDNYIEIVSASGQVFEVGDCNLDGSVDIRDVTAIQRHIAELEVFTDEQIALADTNGDGEINISDATHLQMYLAEYDVELGKA